MDEISDKEVIQKIRKGEIDHFEILVNKYSKVVFYYTKSKVKNEQDAEDIVQNAFIKMYKSIDKFDAKQAFYPYFFTIIKNEINEFFRKNKVFYALDEEIVGHEDVDSSSLDLSYLFANLKPESRQVLQLYFIEGYSYKEIADKLKKPINTIKTLLFRAKQEAKEKIGGSI